MRPLNLVMQAFGPFANKVEIDFDKLGANNIYLISGVTGSGKTTIFDAICYALFNSSSGSNRGSSTLRSHFASDEVESYVELSFLFNNQIYKIIRHPSYERKKTRGEGFIQERAKATMFLPDGKIIDKANEVDSYVEELLGVNVAQFSQIALLAQGEFLKLLNADTQTRAEVFRNIFKTWNYSEFQKKLRDESSTLKKDYDNTLELIMQLIEGIVPLKDEFKLLQDNFIQNHFFDSLEEFLSFLNEQNDLDEKAIEAIKKSTDELDIKIKEQQEQLRKINSKLALIKQIDDLNNSIAQKKENFTSLKSDFDGLKDKRLELENIAIEIKKADDNYKKTLEVKKLADNEANINRLLANIQKALDDEIKALEECKINYHQASINQYIKNDEQLKLEQNEFLKLQDNVNKLSKKYQKAYNDYLALQAGIIAKTLKENEPCPVCGSLDHPNIATIENNELTREFVDNLKVELDNQNDFLSKKSKDCSVLNEKNKIYLEKVDLLARKFSFKTNLEFNSVKEIDYEEELIKIDTSIEEKNKELNELNQELKVVQTKIAGLIKEIDSNDIEAVLGLHNELTKKYDALDKLINQIEADYQKVSLEITTLEANCKLLNVQLLEYKEIDETKNEDISKVIDEFMSQIEKLDLELREIIARKSINEKNYQSLVVKYGEFNKISKSYSNYKILSECANGGMRGKIRIPFEQYIQGYYLDLVLYEANKHLGLMTKNQFQLFRKTDITSMQSKAGLDLEVMDFHTYKKRSTKTLSGGESFKAALALALGLSDCVSNFSGALNIDSLFIDEGFGSLDSESLELALEVVFNLSSNNRIIGLISHIDDLKLKIQNQINTYKSDKGSKIEVNFN